MARRINNAYQFGNAIPAPIVVRPPTLDVAGLEAAYAWMPINRSVGFGLAFEWFAANQAALVHGDVLSADDIKATERAGKAQELGNSSLIMGEKVQAWTTAIRLLEKAYHRKTFPRITATMDRTSLTPEVAAVKAVLDALKEIFGPYGVTFEATLDAERGLDAGMIAIPLAQLQASVAVPLLRVAMAETVGAAKAACLRPDPENGRMRLDGAAFVQVLPQMLESAYLWAEQIKDHAFRPLRKGLKLKVSKRKANTSTAAKKGARLRISAVDPFGIFRPDTIKAAIAQRLSSRQFVPLHELKGLCKSYGVSAGMTGTALKDLAKKAQVHFEYSPDHKSVRIK